MKKVLFFLMCLLNSIWASAQFSGSGGGTQSDPYLIYNENQLAQVANFLGQEGVVFKLMKDLDLSDFIESNYSSIGWQPIGVESSPFMGVFHGNNHTLSGLSINRSTDNIGFFGYTENAIIDNLSIENVDITGGQNVGGIVGYDANASTISNCNVASSTIKGKSGCGGIVGFGLKSSIKNCSYTGSVSSNSNGATGGIVGYLKSGTIIGASASARVVGLFGVGGLAGTLSNGSNVSDISVEGNVTGTGNMIGGLAGFLSGGEQSFSECYYSGDVKGAGKVGGAVGNGGNCAISLENVVSKGTIQGTADYIGGLLGICDNGKIVSISNSGHFGNITGVNYVGGLVGGSTSNVTSMPALHRYYLHSKKTGVASISIEETFTSSAAVILNCAAIGNITGKNYVGGLFGNDAQIISSVQKTKNCNAPDFDQYAIDNVVQKVDIPYHIDYFSYTHSNTDISNSYFSGNISGENYVGGLCGSKEAGSIKCCYAYSTVKGGKYVGSLLGMANGTAETRANSVTNLTIPAQLLTLESNVANVNEVNASASDVGRLVGIVGSNDYVNFGAAGSKEANRNLVTTKVINCGVAQTIADSDKEGTSIGVNMLKLKANYVAWGWNFDSNWNILETESYPYKKFQAAPPVITSKFESHDTQISGKSVDVSKVYLKIGENLTSISCLGDTWTITTDELQSGQQIQLYADKDSKLPSYILNETVKFPGKGTADDPYRIYTANDIQNAVNSGYFKVMNDIDLTSWINANSNTKGWVPVGRNSTDPTYIDGDGHTISGLWIDNTEDYNGLFSSYLTGYIKNLNVETTSKGVKGGDYTGILIGKIEGGQILNCNVKGNAIGTVNIGGIAGYTASATLNNNTYSGKISSGTDNSYIGGIAGFAGSSKSSNNKTIVSIDAKGNKCSVGGLFGRGSEITNGFADVQITSSGKNCLVGGLAGDVHSPIKFSYSVGSINVSGIDSYTGGLVGKTNNSINDSYSSVNVTGTLYTAGLVACNTGVINRCYASGNVDGVQYGAGLVAELVGANAKSSNSVAANNIVNLTSPSSWGCRVIGGFKDGCAEPELGSNLALKTMQVSLNNIAQNKKDDNIEGVAKTENELKSSATYSSLGWNMTDVWTIEEGKNYPTLKWDTKVVPTVISVKSISLNKSSLSLKEGETATLTASILPENATNKTVTWKSSDASVATVDNGKVVALKEGNATITVTSNDGSNVNVSCSITVSSAIVMYSVTASSDDESMGTVSGSGEYAIGNEVTLIATPTEGYEFVKWSDETNENPYTFTVTKDISISAIFKEKHDGPTDPDDSDLEPSTDVSQYPIALYINDVESRAGDLNLDLSMKCEKENITAYQCDVYLPEGVTWKYTTDKRGKVIYTLPTFNEDRTDDSYHTITPIAKMADGSYSIIVYSMDKEYILETDGVLMTLPLEISQDMEAGDYNIIMKNIVLTDVDKKQTLIGKMVSKLTIPSYNIGDVNGDDLINVTDIVGIIDLMRGEGEGCIREAADINDDGLINVTDIVGVIDLMRGEPSAAKASSFLAMAKGMRSPSTDCDKCNLEVIPFTVANGTTTSTAKLNLNNPGDEFTAFQCDVYFPEGISWATTVDKRGNVKVTQPTFNAEADRTDASYHTVNAGLNSNGSFNVVVYSMNKEIILDEEGAVLNMPFVFDANLKPGVYDITLKNIVLTRTDKSDEKPANYTFSVIVGSLEDNAIVLHGDFTADAITEYNTVLAENTSVASVDLSNAKAVDGTKEITTGNKNSIIYVADGVSIKNTKNVVVGNECSNFVLNDNFNFTVLKSLTATTATYNATVSASLGYKTLVLPYNCDVPDGFEAYEIGSLTGNTLNMVQVQTITADKPVILKNAGTAAMAAMNVTVNATNGAALDNGMLVGTYSEMLAPVGSYVLQNIGGNVAFYPVAEGKQPKVGAFRAYLKAGVSQAKALNLNFDGTVTGIDAVEADTDVMTYNINGQRINNNSNGLRIVRSANGVVKKI